MPPRLDLRRDRGRPPQFSDAAALGGSRARRGEPAGALRAQGLCSWLPDARGRHRGLLPGVRVLPPRVRRRAAVERPGGRDQVADHRCDRLRERQEGGAAARAGVRVLVTGAGGFVGSHAVRHLLERGDEVAAIVRSPSALPRLEDVAGRVTLVEGDLASPGRWRKQVAAWHPEACVHAAWYAEPGLYLQSTKSLDGLRNSLTLLEELAG